MGAAFKFADMIRREEGTSSFIPYTSHVTENTIKLSDGDFIQVLRMQGAAHESADTVDINVWHEQLNNFLRNIASPQVAVWSHVVRRARGEYPAGTFRQDFCHQLNTKYQAHMMGDRMLMNELYLTIVYRSQPAQAGRMVEMFSRPDPSAVMERQQDAIAALDEIVDVAMSSLDRYEPEVLGCYTYGGNHYSEVLEFLAYLVDGEWRRFPLPRSEIRDVLVSARPFFGKGGLMSLKGPTHTQYAGMLSVQEYPSTTCPGILNGLLSMPCEIVVSQSFTFLSKSVALGRMKRQQARMVNAGDLAISQVDQIDQALDDLVSNRFVMGAHSMSIFVRADEQKSLTEYISDIGACLSDVGIKWAREDIGIAGAFWAQLPGNFAYRIRVGDITSRNFAGFSCFHNYPTGRIRGNQWGDAVTMFRTTSGAPYYFNFHKGEPGKAARLDPNHKDLANTIVIGKSGTGKTVLEMFLLAQVLKFSQPDSGKKLSCVLFDKDLGASVGIRAMGGRYYPLKNGVPTGFNPFQMAANPNNLSFLEKLVRQLVKHDGAPFTPRQEREISEAIRGVMGASQEKRRLSAVLEFLDPTDADGLHARLSKWCQGGVFGWLFDNAEDTLSLGDCPILGFDVTEFLENDLTRTPTIMYLFHRIESLMDGRRIPIFLDEFWKLLDDPAFEDLAKNKLVTIRRTGI